MTTADNASPPRSAPLDVSTFGRSDVSPLIGITADIAEERYQCGRAYASCVRAAGGVPVILPCELACLPRYLELCDAFILSGGDDPDTSRWGVATHPKAKVLHPERQAFEVALLEALEQRSATPVLGICLGMQLMGLRAGGTLDQHLPDSCPTADAHWGRRSHEIAGELGRGSVLSHHRQALSDAGSLAVIATAPDGLIEAVQDRSRRFYLGVQWHPERTSDAGLGRDLFRRLINAAIPVHAGARAR